MDDYKKIIQQIRNKVFHPVYLLFGEEPYYIDLISKVIEEEVLAPHEQEFNQVVLYGYDTDASQLIATAKRFPMMSNHLVVVVREAQMMKQIELLQPYLEHPMQSTLLVLCYKYKKPDKRKPFYKTIQKSGLAFESAKLKDYQLPNWIVTYVREHGYQINDRNCLLLSENLGNDLAKIANELEKVFISLPPGSPITTEIIEQNIGISKDFNVFELQNALGNKDVFRATRIILHFGNNPKEHPLPMLISVLYGYFSKLLKMHFVTTRDKQQIASQLGIHPFFVTDYQKAAGNFPVQKIIRIIEHLRSCDVKSKGVDNISTSHAELLKELVFKILH